MAIKGWRNESKVSNSTPLNKYKSAAGGECLISPSSVESNSAIQCGGNSRGVETRL